MMALRNCLVFKVLQWYCIYYKTRILISERYVLKYLWTLWYAEFSLKIICDGEVGEDIVESRSTRCWELLKSGERYTGVSYSILSIFNMFEIFYNKIKGKKLQNNKLYTQRALPWLFVGFGPSLFGSHPKCHLLWEALPDDLLCGCSPSLSPLPFIVAVSSPSFCL